MNHYPHSIDLLDKNIISGSSISHDWANVRYKKNNNKKWNNRNRHLLCVAYGSATELTLLIL